MNEMVFSKIMRGLYEAKAYLEGEQAGYGVTVPPCESGMTEEGYLDSEKSQP